MWVPGIDSRRRLGISFFITASRMTTGPPKLISNGQQGDVSLGLKQPGRKTDPCNAEDKITWSYTFTFPICHHGVGLN
jgi:hypothetical protein